MRNFVFFLAIGFVFAIFPWMIDSKTITIDNDFSDWDDVESLVTDVADVTGTTYYWDATASAWTTTDPGGDTYVTNQEQMLDILDFKMTHDNANMYVMMESVYPMNGVYDEANDRYVPFGFPTDYDETGMPVSFSPDTPAAFDHTMVLSFDVDQDGLFDNYGATRFQWSAGASGEDLMTITRTIYQDDGDGAYTPDTDTVVETETNPEENVSAETSLEEDQEMFAQIEVSNPLSEEALGAFLAWGDSFDVRLETHSDLGDVTETKEYILTEQTISEDALIVGTGKGEAGSLGAGVVTAYDPATGEEFLSFTAYEANVGARVAVGDVDGDGEQEIVTLPWKQAKKPELKTFDLSGEEETSNPVFNKNRKNPWKNPLKFNLAVGDLDEDGTDEIVVVNAGYKKMLVLVLNVTDSGNLKLVDRYFQIVEGYKNGAWLEIANVDTSTDALEIITSPLFGGTAHFDVWQLDDDELSLLASNDIVTTNPYKKGVQIAAKGGTIYTYLRLKGGKVNDYSYADGEFTKGDVAIDTLGLIGDLTTAGDNLAISAWNKKEVTIYDTDGEEVLTIDVGSKGAFLDYLNL